jgi:uncharacterized protein YeaC (DUF1315 family)
MIFKFLTVPWTNKTKKVQAVQLWEVRWESRYGEMGSDTRPEMEAFSSEEEARKFKSSLENAFRILRHTSGTRVTLEKGKEI